MKQFILKTALDLDQAAVSANPISQISIKQKLSLADAYEIQALSIRKRIIRGEVLTGYKLGFTSKAKMEQMNIHEVIWGRLTDSMRIQNGETLDISKFIHPRVEPEVAFRISKPIDKVLTFDNVFEHFDAVAPAIEVIDSRYENFKFTLEDVVADNCSSSAYVIGDWHSPETAIQDLQITLSINHTTVQNGNSKAILGNPLESLIEMSKMSVKYNESISTGKIILAGAATSAEYVKSGDHVQANFDGFGTVTINVGNA